MTAQTLKVNIEGLRNSDGQVILSLFDTGEAFDDEESLKDFKFKKSKVEEGKMIVEFEIPVGNFGLTLHDDENEDSEMNYSWLAMPEEGFGFSDYYLSGLSKPDLDEFDFEIKDGETKTITIKVRYM